jgi:hypothetical protein
MRAYYTIVLLLKKLGFDRTLGLVFISQILRLITGPVTAFLLIKYLSPVHQGIYYTIGSISAIQIIFESGMGQCILKATSSRFTGDGNQLSKTRMLRAEDQHNVGPVFYFAVRFFSGMAILYIIVSVIISYIFFKNFILVTDAVFTASSISIIGTALSMLLISVSGVLEGLQQIETVFKARLVSAIAQFGAIVASLICGLDILTIGIVSIVSPITFLVVIVIIWPKFLQKLWKSGKGQHLEWKVEIWPFQKRMIINSLCAYAAWSFATPLIFKMVNPIAAGQYALNWGILRSIAGFAGTWTYAKLGMFGQLIQQGNHKEVSQKINRLTIQGMTAYIAGSFAYICVILLLEIIKPDYANRFGPISLVIVLVITNLLQLFILMRSHYMHAYGVDGFVSLTILTTLITVSSQIYFSRNYGAFGVALCATVTLCLMASLAPWLLRKTINNKITELSNSNFTSHSKTL